MVDQFAGGAYVFGQIDLAKVIVAVVVVDIEDANTGGQVFADRADAVERRAIDDNSRAVAGQV